MGCDGRFLAACRTADSTTRASPARDGPPSLRGWCLRPSCMYCARAASGGRCPRSVLAVPARSTRDFSNGRRPVCSKPNGSKRHLLVDERGVPLSLIVTGARRHDVTQLEAVLSAIMVRREGPLAPPKHLCADAGYCCWRALQSNQTHDYIPHVVDRRKEADLKRSNPEQKA